MPFLNSNDLSNVVLSAIIINVFCARWSCEMHEYFGNTENMIDICNVLQQINYIRQTYYLKKQNLFFQAIAHLDIKMCFYVFHMKKY